MSHRTRLPLVALLANTILASGLAVALAPVAAADNTSDLKAAVDRTRGQCPALQQDPTLDSVAARANNETVAYIEHTAKFVPFEDAMAVLKDLGYPAGKAKLLAGYSDTASKATRGVTSQGFLAIADCSYSKYGLNTLVGPNGNYTLAAVVLSGN